jgi:ATP-dependent DNA helicase RecG
LQETFVAFANADGGDIWAGVEDKKTSSERIVGYKNKEDANDLLKVLLEATSPAVENVDIEFIDFGKKGYVLHLSIPKSPKVHYTTNGDCFFRLNASTNNIEGRNDFT